MSSFKPEQADIRGAYLRLCRASSDFLNHGKVPALTLEPEPHLTMRLPAHS
jgi:hypothetical protein